MNPNTQPPRCILPLIVFSQFAGTSLWFAGNAVLGDLEARFALGDNAVSHLTSAVQLGFIAGTLLFALSNLSDRFSPRRVFFCCAVLGALCNLAIAVIARGMASLIVLRFATGVFLAGVYPVGMKIAASWYKRGLGQALGFLVGALVVGTAFPHLLRALGSELPWQSVLFATSGLAAAGGFSILLWVPNGPSLPVRSNFNPRALVLIFRSREFRASAFGYFGHMWELYAFWTFVPIWLTAYAQRHDSPLGVSWWAFVTIVAGSVGCVAGGVVSRRFGNESVAAVQLLASSLCCFLSPIVFLVAPRPLMLVVLLVWGAAVVGDSPQFSTLNAQTAPREYVGSALAIVTSIGFLITIPSIQLTGWLVSVLHDSLWLVPLGVGPILGLFSLRPLLRR